MGKPIKITKRDLLDIRIERWNTNNARKKSDEALFCNYIETRLYEILTDIGYEVKTISREFMLAYGRLDFLVQLENGDFIIIEVKHSNEKTNSDLMFCYAIGQLYAYAASLSVSFDVPKEKIRFMIITDIDSLLLHTAIGQFNLPITYIVLGDEVAKVYD